MVEPPGPGSSKKTRASMPVAVVTYWIRQGWPWARFSKATARRASSTIGKRTQGGWAPVGWGT